jgi:(p)ppGpp synthase/HD superfamily hydrolase
MRDAAALPLTREALDDARRLHAGQRRKADGAPFVAHPHEVASVLRRIGAPEHLIAAGALHDVIEKTAATPSYLRARYGRRITALVLAVSEDKHIAGYAARKAALRRQVADAGEEALMLFAADKLSKVRELRLEAALAAAPPERAVRAPARKRRLAHYQRSLALLQERLPESPLVRELEVEVESLLASSAARRTPLRRS